jgi:hypothetical protein
MPEKRPRHSKRSASQVWASLDEDWEPGDDPSDWDPDDEESPEVDGFGEGPSGAL